MNCPECGEEMHGITHYQFSVPDNCPEDGMMSDEPVEHSQHCPECGHVLDDSETFDYNSVQ